MNKIIQGDCLEVMKDIDDKSIDMVLTSPPYDNLRTYNGSLDWGEHVWKPVIEELFRVVKDGGVVVWVVGDTILDPFAGSGTVGKMAQQLNRNYILIEKESEYVKIAEARIKAIPDTLL